MNLNDMFEGKPTALDRWRAAADERLKQQDKDTAEYERKKGPDFEQEYQKWRREVHGGDGVVEWEDTAPGHDRSQEELRPVEESQHYNSGSMAAVKGKPYSSNPHPKGSQEHLEWSKGHNAMRARRAELDEAKGLGKCVEITRGPDAGKIGYVRQIKTDRLRDIRYLDLDLKDGGQTVVKSNEVRIVKEQGVAEGWSGNEPTWVCVNGKKWKLFPTEDHARNVGNKLQAKLRTEGRKDQVSYISTEADIDEGSMTSAEHHHTGPEFTGYWKGTDSGTPGNKMVGGMEESTDTQQRDPNTGKVKSWKHEGDWEKSKNKDPRGQVTHMSDVARRETDKQTTDEGAKVDRMAKHIEKSERELGKSKKDAESIAWATLNKRGYLDNANKKKHNESVNFMEWAVAQGTRFPNFTANPEVYAEAKAAYIAEGFGTALANVSSKISGHPRKIKSAQQIRNKATKFAPQPIAEMGAEFTSHGGLGGLLKDHAVPALAFAAVAASVGIQKAVEVLERSEAKFAKLARHAIKTIDREVIHKTAQKLHDLGAAVMEDDPCWKGYHQIGMKDKGGRQVPNCVPVKEDELDEDWQKVNKRDKTDGMSKKAVKAYRREHPGSKLQTAVTTKPSKLKKGSKASKRRSSYCARSAGQKKMHNIDCSKTPDKAICKARRRWNCESQEQFDAMLREAVEKNSELQPGQYYIWTVYFDDGSKQRIKVTKDTFDPKAYYAKKNKVVINVDYSWEPHNGQ